MQSLNISRIHDEWIFGHHRARVHVTQRPIIHARFFQILRRARRIRRIRRGKLRVQHPDGKSVVRLAHERRRQIFPHMARPVAPSVNRRHALPLHEKRNCRHAIRRKNMHRLRQRNVRPPRVVRVMISMHDENLDPRLRRAVHLPRKRQLRRQTVMRIIVHVAGNQNRVHMRRDRRVHHRLKRTKRRLPNRFRPRTHVPATKPGKRLSQM